MDRIRDIWGARTPFASGTAWPERVDEFLVDGVAASEVERWVRGACLLCSNGCGLEIAVRDGRMVEFAGAPKTASIMAGSAQGVIWLAGRTT